MAGATAPYTYYVSAAVRAHHAVHVTHYQEGVDKAFMKYREAVSARTALAPSAGTALRLIQGHRDYKAARATFEREELAEAALSAEHDEEADYLNAELDVVAPLLTAINARRESIAAPPARSAETCDPRRGRKGRPVRPRRTAAPQRGADEASVPRASSPVD